MRYLQVFVPVPDRRTASRISRTLLEERLAGCVQISGPIVSSYWWEGKIEQSREWLLLIKTDKAHYPLLERRIRELHPYRVPEIIALAITAGYQPYLNWLVSELTASRSRSAGRRS
ncbi:MAG: divalent-cation tolerance protein CutA [candidate division WOR-3 bacterium]|uniref:Divalent-cation tolerance protein CutA n=1 Tax=candidate division WOR-3 bacterium TaxID=2052148 RepID=A0A7C3IN04_UNCW3|nr:divalent-cation tolerance protein CutA [candidate division WOR-3 bacterium]